MVTRPSKIVCVGRNYAAHARELGNAVPERPLIFLKPPTSVIGHGETILLPPESQLVEHEAEIGLVMGRRLGRGADESAARAAIAGLACVNDVTCRDFQRLDVQFTRAKGYDTFCPIGAMKAVGPDFDYGSLTVVCRVNGLERQRGLSRDMIFGIPMLVAYISNIMTLEPGDVISTGTPEGVGPLRPGDVVDVEIPGIGLLRNPVAARSV